MFSLDKEMKRFSFTMTGRQRKGYRNIRPPTGCELPEHPPGKAASLESSSRIPREALPGKQAPSQARAAMRQHLAETPSTTNHIQPQVRARDILY